MRYFVVGFFLYCSAALFGQKDEIDRLEAELNSYQMQDTFRLKLLNELSFQYATFDAKYGEQLADSAVVLAEKIRMPRLKGIAFRHKAWNQYMLGKYVGAMDSNNKALDIFEMRNDTTEIAKTVLETGKVYIQVSKLDSSIVAFKRALTLFNSKKDSLDIAITKNCLAVSYLFNGKVKEALQNFLFAATLFNDLGDEHPADNADFQANFGLYYYMVEDYNAAIRQYSKALEIHEQLEIPKSVGNDLMNIGNAYIELGLNKMAEEYYHKALNAFETAKFAKGKANAIVNLGIIQFNSKNYQEAISVFNKALPIYEEWGDNRGMSSIYHNLGRAHLSLFKANNDKSLLFKAQEYFNLADEKGKKSGNPRRVVYPKTFVAELHKLLGNDDKSKDLIIEAYRMRDSIFSKQVMREVTQIEEDYKADLEKATLAANAEKEQLLAAREIENQKYLKKLYAVSGTTVFSVALVGFFLSQRRNKAIEELKRAENETKVATTELKVLRAQMNPHFIFNSLNSIDNYLLSNDKEATSDYLKKFAKLMRMTLENSEHEEISLSEDLALLKTYFEIESKRIPDRFRYFFKIEDGVDIENILVPPLILQPFIENSIWHGLAGVKTTVTIIIEVKKQEDSLIYIVDDNGIGRNIKERRDSKRSMGIHLTKNRIAIINKNSDTRDSVKIIDKVNGLRVELKLPLNIAF